MFLLFFSIALIIYANTIRNGFVLDDQDLIVNNAYIKNFEFLPRLFSNNAYHFSSSPGSNYYRPLQLVSYAIDHHFWRLDPAYYHFGNIFFHAINSFLVCILVLRLFASFRLALLSGLLFCVHPVHASVVGYIAGRADLFVTFFMLLSLLDFLNYLKTKKLYKYVMSLLFFGLALLSRENSLLLPFILILLAFVQGEKIKKILLPLAGFLALAVFYIYGRFLFLGGLAMLVPEVKLFSLPLELVNLAGIMKEYLSVILFPWSFYPMRTIPFIETLTLWNVLWAVYLFGLAGSLFLWAFLKRKRLFVFGILWFICGFLPLIRMMYLFPRFGIVVAENWMYLPSIGIFIILSRLFLIKKNGWLLWIFILFFCYCSVLTILNNGHWKDRVTLYRYILKAYPDNTNIRLNLAYIYFDNGSYDLALREFNKILESEPTAWDVYLGLGNIYYAKGELERAVLFYDQAILFNHNCGLAYYNKGLISVRQSKYDEARDFFFKALEINQDYWPTYLALGDWFSRKGMDREALIMYEKAERLNPDSNILLKTSVVLIRQKEYQKAVVVLEGVLKRDPNSIEAVKMLGLCYGQMGRSDDPPNL